MALSKQKIKSLKKWKKKYSLLVLIFFAGLIFRLLGVINISLAGDNLIHWKIVGDILEKGVFPLLGPNASVNPNFNLGPFYYYLLAIPYFLGNGNFKIAVIFFSILNSLSIIILYFVSLRWFTKIQSLKIISLYAFSCYMITLGNFPWNPYILPLFIIISFYFVNKVKQGKYNFFYLLSLTYGICLQAHATAIFLFPIILYFLPLKKIPIKQYFLAMFIFLLINMPWIYANLSSNFNQVKEGLSILLQGKTEYCSFGYWLLNHGNGESCFFYFRNTLFIFRFISMSLFNSANIILVFLTMFAIFIYFIKEKMSEKKFLFIWLIIPILLFLFYSSFIYLHYFLILTPLPFFIFVAILSKFERLGRRSLLLSKIIFISVIIINIIQYIYSLQFSRG